MLPFRFHRSTTLLWYLPNTCFSAVQWCWTHSCWWSAPSSPWWTRGCAPAPSGTQPGSSLWACSPLQTSSGTRLPPLGLSQAAVRGHAHHYRLHQVVHACPLWDSARQQFVGMLTITGFIRYTPAPSGTQPGSSLWACSPLQTSSGTPHWKAWNNPGLRIRIRIGSGFNWKVHVLKCWMASFESWRLLR